MLYQCAWNGEEISSAIIKGVKFGEVCWGRIDTLQYIAVLIDTNMMESKVDIGKIGNLA